MALLAPQQIQLPGVAVNYVAATVTTGDTVQPDGRTFVHVKNGSGVSVTATVTTPGTSYGSAIPDAPTTIAAGADRFIAVAGADLVDPATGLVTVICNPVTTVTLAAVRA